MGEKSSNDHIIKDFNWMIWIKALYNMRIKIQNFKLKSKISSYLKIYNLVFKNVEIFLKL